MTLDQALQRASKKFDRIAADVLANTEALLKNHGCTPEEGALEEERTRAELARVRQHMNALIVQAFYGRELAPVWKAADSGIIQ